MNKALFLGILISVLASAGLVSAALSDGLLRDYGMDYEGNIMKDYTNNSDGYNVDAGNSVVWTPNGKFGGGYSSNFNTGPVAAASIRKSVV